MLVFRRKAGTAPLGLAALPGLAVTIVQAFIRS
jgi:hypothetical protein